MAEVKRKYSKIEKVEDSMKTYDWNKMGIVGAGNFGRLLGLIFPGSYIYDNNPKAANLFSREPVPFVQWTDSLETIVQQDVIMLAVPIASMKQAMFSIAEVLKDFNPGPVGDSHRPIVVNLASVQTVSSDIILRSMQEKGREVWPVGAHFLFGPQTVKSKGGSIEGLECVVCAWQNDDYDTQAFMWKCADALGELLKTKGLSVKTMLAQEHDEAMRVHAMAQTLAWLLRSEPIGLGVRETDRRLMTTSAKKLLGLLDFLEGDFPEPCKSVRFNPAMAQMEDQLIRALTELANHRLSFDELYLKL
jgi:prephenate dehydrogenase